MDLAAEIVPALPAVHAIVFEMVPDQFTSGRVALLELLTQLERMQEIWTRRSRGGRAAAAPRRPAPQPCTVELRTPGEWEIALAGAVARRDVPGHLAGTLRADPGVGVIRRVVDQVRAGRLVDSLRYTYRLIVLTRGEERFLELLDSFRRATGPELFTADEVAAFGAYLLAHAPDVPHLADTVALEFAGLRARSEGTDQTVRVGVNPLALLAALGEGRPPPPLAPGDYRTVVQPSSRSVPRFPKRPSSRTTPPVQARVGTFADSSTPRHH